MIRLRNNYKKFVFLEVGQATYPIPPIGYGAGERTIFFLSKYLKLNGHTVLIIDFPRKSRCNFKKKEGVLIFEVPFPLKIPPRINTTVYYLNALFSMLFLIIWYIRIFKQVGIDVIHFHSSPQTIIFSLFKRIFKR